MSIQITAISDFNNIRRNWEISIFDNIKNVENFQIKF